MSSPTITPKPATIAGAVNQSQGSKLPLPKGLEAFDTSNLGTKYFHCCVFGPTNSGKTSLAASFASPEDTRIIVTRNKSQLISLEGLGYQGTIASNLDALQYAMMFPERLWPEWAGRPNRTLIVDDLTECAEMCVEDNQTTEAGKELKDTRLVFRGVKTDVRTIFRSTIYKPQNVIFTALVRVGKDPVRKTEVIQPEVPPSIFHMLGAEIEFAFYIDDEKKKLLTEPEKFAVTDPGEIDPQTRAPKVFRREIFAKYKQPKNLPKLLDKYEPMDLAAIWKKITDAKGAKG